MIEDNPLRDLNNARNLPKYEKEWERIEQMSEEEREAIATFTLDASLTERLERERDEAREKATKAWEENLKLDTENRRLEQQRDTAQLESGRLRDRVNHLERMHVKLIEKNEEQGWKITQLERKLEDLRLAYNEAVAEPSLKLRRRE